MYTHVLYRLRESSGRIPNSSSQCFTQKVWNRERKIPLLIYMLHLLTFRSYFVMMFFNETLKKTFKSFPWFPSEWGLSPSSGSTQPCWTGAHALSHGFPTEGTTLALILQYWTKAPKLAYRWKYCAFVLKTLRWGSRSSGPLKLKKKAYKPYIVEHHN